MGGTEKDILMETNEANETNEASETNEANETNTPNFQITGQVTSNPQRDPTKLLDPALLEILIDIREKNQIINKKLDILVNRQDTIDRKIDACASESKKAYEHLEKENSTLRHKLEFLEKENELLYRQTNFQNLILLGLSDEENESDYTLFNRVSNVINNITETDIKLDTVYKIGRFQNDTQRPIRIRFLSHSDRNYSYESRERLTDNMTLKEDLPFRVRQDLNALRKKRAELFQENIKHTINWKTKTIAISDGSQVTVKDGNIVPVKGPNTNRQFPLSTVNSKNTSFNANNSQEEVQEVSLDGEPPNKKSKPDGPSHFLGKPYFLRSQNGHTSGKATGTRNQAERGRKGGRGRGSQGQGPQLIG